MFFSGIAVIMFISNSCNIHQDNEIDNEIQEVSDLLEKSLVITPRLRSEFSLQSQRLSLHQKNINDYFYHIINDCMMALEHSQKVTIPIKGRIALFPQCNWKESVSGSYIVLGSDKSRQLIVKPANQEAGGPHSPTEKFPVKKGIFPGEGAIREYLAFLIQQLLDVDFGIPPTYIGPMSHPLFGDAATLEEAKKELQKDQAYGSLEKLIPLIEAEKDADSFIDSVFSDDIDTVIEKLQDQELMISEISAIYKFCMDYDGIPNRANMRSFLNSAFDMKPSSHPTTKPISSAMRSLCKIFRKKTRCHLSLSHIFNIFTRATQPTMAFVSSQQFIHGCKSLQSQKDKIYSKYNDTEVFKFLIDIICFNTDRHAGNVLVKGDGTDKKFVLIDHGSILPLPSTKYFGSLVPEYCFLEFANCDRPIHGPIKEKLLSLDIENFIKTIKEHISAKRMLHPEYAESYDLPRECYMLLDLNLRLVQKGLQLNCSLGKMASFHTRITGGLIDSLKKVITIEGELNYQLLDQELEKFFSLTDQ